MNAAMFIAKNDLVEGWMRKRLWLTLAYDDIHLRYKRSFLGPLWITFGTGFFIAVLSVLWTDIMGRNASIFVPWFAVGLITWQFISAVVMEGPTVFARVSGIIQNIAMPLSIHVYRAVMRHVINYLHNTVIILLVLFIFPPPITGSILLLIPGFIILVITAIAASVTLGILGARFRDFSYTVSMLMGPIFFVTPIIWMPDMISGDRLTLAKINPFTHFLAIIREPLLGREPTFLNYTVTLSVSMLLVSLALYFLGQNRTKVPYWV